MPRGPSGLKATAGTSGKSDHHGLNMTSVNDTAAFRNRVGRERKAREGAAVAQVLRPAIAARLQCVRAHTLGQEARAGSPLSPARDSAPLRRLPASLPPPATPQRA